MIKDHFYSLPDVEEFIPIDTPLSLIFPVQEEMSRNQTKVIIKT
jgi:hypothetical protein